ncbi:MAG: hypothetical protein IJ109_00845 [Firmicutes bacterium]|nr:hypothetical protein [Bacillota bacterium]
MRQGQRRERRFLRPAVLLAILGIAAIMASATAAAAEDNIVEVSTPQQLTEAMAQASTDASHPTRIVLTQSIAMPAGQPVNSREGTYAELSGGTDRIALTADSGWAATSAVVTAEKVPALVEVAGMLSIRNLTIDTAEAAKGVRCIGVAATGDLALEQTSITGSKLTTRGGLGIYTLGSVVMNDGAAVENISVSTSSTITGVGICVGYDRQTKVQGSLIMNAGSAVRGNKSLKQNGARLNGIGIYCQGHLEMNDGADIYGNTSVYSDTGIGVYLEGGGAASPASFDMNGGTIRENKETGSAQSMYGAEGGGLCVYNNASFRMSGGAICDNLARGGGGGILLNGVTNCQAELQEGRIEGNRSYANGGGIYISQEKASLRLDSGAQITGNINEFDKQEAAAAGLQNHTNYHTNNGGGIYNSGTLEMTGGRIEGNRAVSSDVSNTDVYGQGGGIFNEGIFTMTGGTITSNESNTGAGGGNKAGSGGGVAVRGGDEPGQAYLAGGSITGNTAGGRGPDVWVNADDSSYNIMARSMNYTANPGELYLGDPAAGKTPLQIGRLTLPEGVTAYIQAPLTGSEICLESLSEETGTTVGVGRDYEILISDVRALTDPQGKQSFNLRGGKIVTGEAAQSTYLDFTEASAEEPPEMVYTGQPLCPEVEVSWHGQILEKDRDYQLAYFNNTDVSTETEPARIRILGMGDYDGMIEKTFRITPRDIADADIAPIRDRLYTGEPIEPAVEITVGGTTLTPGEDFDVSCSDNVEQGTAGIRITGKGNFRGEETASFAIVSREGKSIASSESELRSLIQAASETETTSGTPAVIYLSGQLAMAGSVTVPENTHIEFIGENEESGLQAAAAFSDPAAGPAGNEASLLHVAGELTLADLTVDMKDADSARIASVGSSGHLSIATGAVLRGGSADLGRAIFSEGALTITGGKITGSDAAFGSRSVFGTVYSSGSLEMTGGSITDNLAVRGGGIYLARNAKAELTGGNISGNRVSGDVRNQPYASYGGGIFAEEGTNLQLGGSLRIEGNSAKQYGGGVAGFGKTVIDGASIEGNQAVLAGAGVYTGGELSLKSGSIASNTLNTTEFAALDAHTDRGQTYSAACGGGVYVQSGTFLMEGGDITGNTARSRYNTNAVINNGAYHGTYFAEMGNGGGVYVANDGSAAATEFIMKGGAITGNAAVSSYLKDNVMGHGGGVYVLGGSDSKTKLSPGRFLLEGGVISGNTASENGDEVFLSDSCRIYQERATEEIAFPGKAVMQVSGSGSVSADATDGIRLPDGMRLSVSGPLTGRLTVSAEGGQEQVIAEGTGSYVLTEEDAAAFANATQLRSPKLRNGSVVLSPVRGISEVCDLSVQDTWTYTGSNIRPQPIVTATDSGKVLSPENYQVIYSRSRSIDPGRYELTVTGEGNYREYGGVLRAKYTIQAVDIAKAQVKALPDQVYTGKAIEPVPATGSITYQGRSMLRGEEYSLSWKNNTEIGTASLIVTGQGNFTGTKTVTFRILPKQAQLKKIKSNKTKTLTVTWTKDAQATGYEILLAKDKKFTKGKKKKIVKKYSAKGLTVKGLTKKKVYYVKMRSYRTVAGVTYYGAYSKVKKLKIK